MDYPIKKAEILDRGVVKHEMHDGSEHHYSSVRAGLVWPSKKSPAYFCVLAEDFLKFTQKDQDNPDQRGMLTLIHERELSGLSIERLCSSAFDDAALYGISTFYCDLDEDYMEYYDAIRDYGYRHRLKSVRCEDAPFKANFEAGIALVFDWDSQKLLTLPPKSLARMQTAEIAGNRKLLDTPDCDLIHHAANALRFVVSGFYRFRPSCYRKPPRYRNRNRRGMVV